MIIGVVAEFNPFHNGHKYFLEKIRAEVGPEPTIIGVISSSFVQRGQGAVLSKWDRASLAIDNGMDLVVELPFVFACQNAEVFSKGAIKTLSLAGIDSLYFGSEIDNPEILIDISKKISKKDQNVDEKIKENLKAGMSFIRARNLAYLESGLLDEKEIEILSQPNNILALEYIKAMDYYSLDVKINSVKRSVDHDSELIKGTFASASKIRKDYFSSKDISNLVPFDPDSYNFIKWDEKILLDILKYLFLVQDIDIKSNIEYEPGLENRIKSSLLKAKDFEDLVEKVSSKRITKARIRRLLINSILDLDRETIFSSLENTRYLRILAMNTKGMDHLRNLNHPYVQKFKDFRDFDFPTKKIYEIEERASKLYSLLTSTPYDLDYKTSPIIKKE